MDIEHTLSTLNAILGHSKIGRAPYAHLALEWQDGTTVTGYPHLVGSDRLYTIRVNLSPDFDRLIDAYALDTKEYFLGTGYYALDLDSILAEIEQTLLDALALHSGMWYEVSLD